MIKIACISLGCEKNLVDSEVILGFFKNNDFEITDNLDEADAILVNTCGFITSAKEEAINTIYEVLEYKDKGAKIIVTGCLVQRYKDELEKGIPGVDLWIPIRDYPNMGKLIASLFNKKEIASCNLSIHDRVISTPKHLAYVKISDGCNNRCNYCAIPLIRGDYVSRDIDDIILEVKYLVKTNRKEICLISQDLTRYGIDLKNVSLVKLLKEICKIEGDFKVRMLYLYPDEITDELIDFVSSSDKVMSYYDIPIQHASNKMLKWMNRRGDKEFIRSLVNKIRSKDKDAIIRTTIIVGFPHETDKDFRELLDFVREVKFDHLGAFTYSKEEGTKGFSMNHQVSKKIAQQRYDELMELQKYISLNQNALHIDKTYKTVIEYYDEDSDTYYGRNYMYAPDDIDGSVIIKSDKKLEISSIYDCTITDADFYDLYGKIEK